MKKLPFFATIVLSVFLFSACKNSPESDKAVTTETKEVPAENAAGKTYHARKDKNGKRKEDCDHW